MVGGLLGDAVIAATVESGLGGVEPESAPTYLAMGNLYFESIESFQNAFGPNAAQIMGDVPIYTNLDAEPLLFGRDSFCA